MHPTALWSAGARIVRLSVEIESPSIESFFPLPPTPENTYRTPTVACVAPMLAYILLTAFAGRFEGNGYAIGYLLAVAATLGITLALNWNRPQLHPSWRFVPGLVVGALGIWGWIWLCQQQWEQAVAAYLPSWLVPGERTGFDPFEELENPAWRNAFLATRLFGIAILVPWIEEVFWRGFLLRYLIDQDWISVPIGSFSVVSCLGVSTMFALAHPEWIAAFAYALLLNTLLYWTKDLWQCVIAHAASNAILAAYVIYYQQWYLW